MNLSFIVCLIKRGYRMNLTVNRPVILIFCFLSDYFLKSFIYKPSSMVQKNWKHWVLSQSEKHLKGPYIRTKDFANYNHNYN